MIRQTLADQPAGERFHLVARMQVPPVQATRELPEVAWEVLHRDLLVRAVIAALEHGPEGFDSVRMHGAPHVFAGLVLHRFVLVPLQTLVRRMLVGMHGGPRRGVHRHELVQDPLSAAVAGSDHGGLADGAAPGPQFLGGVLGAFLAAEIGLVDFDRSGGRGLPLGLSLANAMAWRKPRSRCRFMLETPLRLVVSK